MSQARVASVMDPGDDVAEMRRIAGQLEEENPWWNALFDVSTLEFVAFPGSTLPRA